MPREAAIVGTKGFFDAGLIIQALYEDQPLRLRAEWRALEKEWQKNALRGATSLRRSVTRTFSGQDVGFKTRVFTGLGHSGGNLLTKEGKFADGLEGLEMRRRVLQIAKAKKLLTLTDKHRMARIMGDELPPALPPMFEGGAARQGRSKVHRHSFGQS